MMLRGAGVGTVAWTTLDTVGDAFLHRSRPVASVIRLTQACRQRGRIGTEHFRQVDNNEFDCLMRCTQVGGHHAGPGVGSLVMDDEGALTPIKSLKRTLQQSPSRVDAVGVFA